MYAARRVQVGAADVGLRLHAHTRPLDAAGALGGASASLGGHAMLILRFALLCSLPGLLLPSPAARTAMERS